MKEEPSLCYGGRGAKAVWYESDKPDVKGLGHDVIDEATREFLEKGGKIEKVKLGKGPFIRDMGHKKSWVNKPWKEKG